MDAQPAGRADLERGVQVGCRPGRGVERRGLVAQTDDLALQRFVRALEPLRHVHVLAQHGAEEGSQEGADHDPDDGRRQRGAEHGAGDPAQERAHRSPAARATPGRVEAADDELEDLGQNRLPKIAKALELDVDDVKAAAETIACLNPLPGKLFGGDKTRFVRPDVVVEEVDGKYEVRVEGNHLPRLQVSSYYRDLYRNAYKDPELKKFVKKKLESAEWLISAIRQRQSTLLRIAQEVVEIQSGFLDHGISHLKPLKMVEVAERVGVHVSTISRAISGKYIQTPRGIFELKSFFTGGAVKSDGTMEARGSVIQRIKELIEHEDKRNPLSDIDIVKKLEESDIRISRRTVTKYREAESIPSSRQRRAY